MSSFNYAEIKIALIALVGALDNAAPHSSSAFFCKSRKQLSCRSPKCALPLAKLSLLSPSEIQGCIREANKSRVVLWHLAIRQHYKLFLPTCLKKLTPYIPVLLQSRSSSFEYSGSLKLKHYSLQQVEFSMVWGLIPYEDPRPHPCSAEHQQCHSRYHAACIPTITGTVLQADVWYTSEQLCPCFLVSYLCWFSFSHQKTKAA